MQIPSLGLGTARNTDEKRCADSVRTALEIGYRHIDTAARYRNETAVGMGLAAADVPREDVFLATKVLHPRLAKASDAAVVKESAYECIDRLGVSYVDLLYVHWPDAYDLTEAFTAFEDLVKEGVVRDVGVCNFTIDLLDDIDSLSEISILANQVEMHPLLQQRELRAYCTARDIRIVAYAPLMRGDIGAVDELREIADKHDTSQAQVSLAWLRQKGAVPIPKATSERHLRENWASLNLELSDADIDRIDSIDRERRVVDPPFAPEW